jgi:serine protease inhibitor
MLTVLGTQVRKMSGVEWAASNGVWVGDDCPVAPEFAAQAGEAHGAGIVGDMPFSTDPERARATINDTVANQTRGHITDLLPPRCGPYPDLGGPWPTS